MLMFTIRGFKGRGSGKEEIRLLDSPHCKRLCVSVLKVWGWAEENGGVLSNRFFYLAGKGEKGLLGRHEMWQ